VGHKTLKCALEEAQNKIDKAQTNALKQPMDKKKNEAEPFDLRKVLLVDEDQSPRRFFSDYA